MEGKGKFMNMSVGAPIVLTQEEHERFQSSGQMPDFADGPPPPQPQADTSVDPPVPVSTPPAEVRKTQEASPDPPHLHVPGQCYAVVSVVVPPQSNHMALKIRGVFETVEKAGEHADQLMGADPRFDIFVVSMYNWLVLPLPDELRGEIQHKYSDERLNKIMGGYHSQREKVKAFNDKRIQDAKEAGEQGVQGDIQEDVAVETEVAVEEAAAPP